MPYSLDRVDNIPKSLDEARRSRKAPGQTTTGVTIFGKDSSRLQHDGLKEYLLSLLIWKRGS